MKISDRYIFLFSTMPMWIISLMMTSFYETLFSLAAFMTAPADFQSVQRQSLLLQVLLW